MAVALRERILFGFGFALVVLGVVSWFSSQNAAVTLDSARWVAHTREVLETLDGVLAEVATADAAYRDFLASGRDSSLVSLDAALDAAPVSLARLGTLTADNPAQQQRLDSLKPLVAERLMWSQRLVDIRRVRGAALAQRALAAAPARILSGEVQRVADEMKAAEQVLLEERTATLNATARRTKVMILAGTALALLLAVLAAFQVSRDLAARQRVEQVLQQSEERFQALADGVKDYAIFWLDPEGRVASWNAGAERLKGYRADEIIGQPLSRFYTPEACAAG